MLIGRRGFALGGVGLAIGAVWWTWGRRSRAVEVVVLERFGDVRVGRADGETSAKAGDVLYVTDRVRTGDGGRAILAVGGRSRIAVAPSSDLVVAGVGADGVRVTLEGGRIEATIFPEDGPVRVGAREQEFVATRADFAIGVDGSTVMARTTSGSLEVLGADIAALSEGTEATFTDRASRVGPVPEELLLDVPWPDGTPTRAATTRLQGTTTPGCRLKIRGPFPGELTARAGADGSFDVEVPLVEGANRVTIVAVDALGRERIVEGVVGQRDTTGPAFSGGAVYRE